MWCSCNKKIHGEGNVRSDAWKKDLQVLDARCAKNQVLNSYVMYLDNKLLACSGVTCFGVW